MLFILSAPELTDMGTLVDGLLCVFFLLPIQVLGYIGFYDLLTQLTYTSYIPHKRCQLIGVDRCDLTDQLPPTYTSKELN